MPINFKTALVTGGAGFIGSHLVDALLANNCEVRVIDNLSSGNLRNLEHVIERIRFQKGDIRDLDALENIMSGCEVVFHQAAVVSVTKTVDDPLGSAAVNEIGTLNVLEAARGCKLPRVVLASSSAVYGDDPELPKNENMNPKALSPYAVQKLTGEFYARLYAELYGLETVCLRYFNVFGPRQDPSSPYSGVISIFLTRAAEIERPIIYGDGQQSRDFIYVKDVVNANVLAANAGNASGKVFNVGTGNIVYINQLWGLISQMARIDIQPIYQDPRPGDIEESVANIDRARDFLSFEPAYQFKKGLEVTYRWYQGQ